MKELTWQQLAGLDCGFRPEPGFPAQRPVPGAGVPRLTDVLAIARGAPYPVRINAEIKMQNLEDGIPVDEFAALVVEALGDSGLEGRVTVQSFDVAALAAVGRIAPRIDLAMIVRDPADYEHLLEASGAGSLLPDFRWLRREDVARYRQRGVRVVPWTVNEPEDIERLIEWGVDGIISDYPDRVLEAIPSPR